MEHFTVTIKNYRCFEDTIPAIIRFRESSFKAFVGKNNAGKSTLLRFFYEFRHVFDALANNPDTLIASTAPGRALHFQANGFEDHNELFFNGNRRDLTFDIQLEIASPGAGTIVGVRVTIPRASPGSFIASYTSTGGAIQRLQHLGGWNFQANFADRSVPLEVKQLVEVCSALKSCMYIGAFRNAISEAQAAYYDISIGSQFIAAWNSWKTGGARALNEVMQDVTDDIASMFGYSRLEINMASSNSPTLQVIADGKPYRLRELGGGLAQFLVVLANVAMKKPQILCIDEPELNLHPSLQHTFLTSLGLYVDYIVFTTHSVGLARSAAEDIFTCQKIYGKTVIRAFEELQSPAEFLGEMSFSAFNDLGATGVLWVEGVTELKTIQQVLRKLNKEQEIVLLPLGGRQLITKERGQQLAEAMRLSNKVSVLVDSERTEKDGPLSNNRQAFVDECKALGMKIHVTSKRATENYFTQVAISAALGGSQTQLHDFDSLEGHANGWNKTVNWKIAREMSKRDWLATDVGEFLNAL
jgi:predicted ATPase